jgi:hypothetical protein
MMVLHLLKQQGLQMSFPCLLAVKVEMVVRLMVLLDPVGLMVELLLVLKVAPLR